MTYINTTQPQAASMGAVRRNYEALLLAIAASSHLSVRRVKQIGFLALLGVGVTSIQVNEYALSIVIWLLSALAIALNIWPERSYKGVSIILRGFAVFAAVAIFLLLSSWTVAKREKDAAPWSNLVALWKPAHFILLGPGVVANGNMWDFIVLLKGDDPAAPVDLRMVDNYKLDYLRGQKRAVMPEEYSVHKHIDQMLPQGRGQLFATQFLWQPLSVDHGYYTVSTSASIGRYQEELYIEKASGGFQYAVKVDDIESHSTKFICRDKDFPESIAPTIRPKHSGRCQGLIYDLDKK